MTPRRWLGVAASVAALLLAGRLLAGTYVEYRWFAALGAAPVWRARFADLVLLRTVGTVLAGAFAFANLAGVSSSVASLILPRRLGNLEIGEEVPGQRLLGAAAIIAAAIGLILSLLLDDWTTVDLLRRGLPFGEEEAYTGHDLAFFVYWLPLENELYVWALVSLVTVTALVVFLYALTPSLRWERSRLSVTGHVRRHLTVLGVVALLILAWGHRLDAYGLLLDGSGDGGAFTRVDHLVGMRVRFGLAVFTAASAVVALRAGWLGQARVAFWTVSGLLLVTLFGRELVPPLVERAIAGQASVRADAGYLRTRALFTGRAFGVARLRAAPDGYGYASLAEAADATPVWDPEAIESAVRRELRQETTVGDVGWQPFGAANLAGVVVQRAEAGPPSARRAEDVWSTLAVPATRVGARGTLAYLDSTGAAVPDPPARDVSVLVHPDAVGYAIVGDTAEGVAGDRFVGPLARLAHAFNQRDLRLLGARAGADHPEIVLRRDVRERVRALTPYFAQGVSVSPLVAGDTLYWTLHLYAASDAYPLSQHYAVAGAERSYFQHAAVAVVNAASGIVTFVSDTAPERIAQSWFARFPTLFGDGAARLPDAVARALPPATDGALVQAWAFAQYGARGEPAAVVRHLPGGDGGDSTVGAGQRALALLPSLRPGGRGAPGWTLPLLDGTDRVSGVVVALGGPSPESAWLPATGAGPRWGELLDRLRRAGERSDSGDAAMEATEAQLVGRGRGRVRGVPIAGTIAWVQPQFLLRSPAAPTLARVALVSGDSARSAPTLRELAGTTGPPPAPGEPPLTGDVRTRVRALYEAMRDALRRGDWRAFGAAFDALGAMTGARPR